tara:strand:+ start:373 stop:651 length:279 start_codon:yes stop_codon:yes gene_type:complete
MTRKPTPNQCDICTEDIDPSQMSYSAQFSQKQPYGEGTKGKFVSSTNKADYCKKCFLETQQGNFKVKWKTMMKDKITDKWIEVDPQQTLVEA